MVLLSNTAGMAGGNGNDKGAGLLGTGLEVLAQLDGAPAFSGADLVAARASMGKFGVNPTKIAYIVSLPAYYKLLEDADFQTVDQIGNDRATILTGQVGQAYGSPVIVSDVLAPGDAGTACVAVNVDAFLVGRLRGVKIETDYEVANQRNAIVATQAIGFSRIQSALAATAVTFTANVG